MPTDVDAILAYGYDLGGPGRWNLRGVDKDLEPTFSWWWNPDSFRQAGMAELDAHRHDPGVDLAGVEILWYGSDTRHSVGIGFILAATRYHTYFSHTQLINPDVLGHHGYEGGQWDKRLGHALDILQLEPATPLGPRWILAASHGI